MHRKERRWLRRAVLCACVLFVLQYLGATPVVNWLDTASYPKPLPVTINEPDENATSNKYWVDMTSGAGTTCSQASPCASIDNVIGKTGTAGGPAIIYIKGSGGWSGFNDTLHGTGDADCRTQSCANWILVKPWPAGSPGCVTECTATFDGNGNTNSANINHIIFDGGPDLKIRFDSNDGTNIYAFHWQSDYTIVYRVQVFCASDGGDHTGFAVADNNNAGDHTYFINNEGHDCAQSSNVQASFVYLGPGSGTTGGANDLVIQNSILRDFGGDGIEINPRIAVTGITITGNVIYNAGNISTFAGSHRPGITVGNNTGAADNGVIVANNLIWNTGSGCIWARANGTPAALYYNNTCYDYTNTGGGTDPQPQGISDINGACPNGTVKNNIIYDPDGNNPTCSSPGASITNNACASGKNCGSSSQVWTTAGWGSISTASSLYLTLASGSVAIDTGTATGAPTAAATDFLGTSRPQGSAYDIGAFEFTSGGGGSPQRFRFIRIGGGE